MSAIEVSGKKMTFSINSDCQCYDCNKCGVGYTGGESGQQCDDCLSGVLENANSCMGCWDDSESHFYDAIFEWRKEVGVDRDMVRIDGRGMGWTKSMGSAVVPIDKALKALTLNGDFRIDVEWSGRSFSARRYSHDEPTGASFYFTLVIGEED